MAQGGASWENLASKVPCIPGSPRPTHPTALSVCDINTATILFILN